MEFSTIKFIPLPSFLVKKRNMEIILLNEKAEGLSGLKANDLKGEKITDFLSLKVIKTGEYKDVKFLTKHNNKELFGFLSVQEITKTKENFFIISIWNTKEKNEEQKNTASEELYKRLFNTSKDAIMTLEPPEWKFSSGNSVITEMFGLKDNNEFTSLDPWEVSPEKQADGTLSNKKALRMIMKAMKNGSHYFKWTHQRRNGENFPATVFLTRIDLANKSFLVATVKDISDQIKTEENLKESERKYKTLIESSNDSIFIVQNGIIKFFNNNLIKISEHKKEELIGKPFIDFVAPDEVNKIMLYYQKRLRGEKVPNNYESVAKLKSGGLCDVEVSIIPIDYQGKPAEQIILRDISKRKEALKALKKSEQKFREFANFLPEIVFEVDKDLNLLYLNKVARETLGFDLSDFKNDRISIDALVNKNEREQFYKSFQNSLNGGTSTGNTYKTRNAKGDQVFVQIFNSQVYKDDKIVGLRGIVTDITKRKNTEDALMKSEKKYREIIDFAPIAFYKTSRDGTILLANLLMAQILGYEKVEDVLNQNISNFYFDLSERKKLIKKHDVPPSPTVKNTEVKFKRKDGSPIWVLMTARAIQNQNNETINYDGFLVDNTARKITQDKLQQSESKLQSILKNSLNGIFVINDKMEITYANDELLEIVAYSRDEILNHNFQEFLDKESVNLVTERYRKRHQGIEVPPRYEFNIVRKNGEKRRVEILSSTIKDKENNIQTIANLTDVTEQRKREKTQKFLYEVSKLSFKELHLREYLTEIHQKLKELINTDNFYIALYNKDNDTYTLPYYHDEYDFFDPTKVITMPNSLTDYIRRTAKAQLVTEDTEKELRKTIKIDLDGEPSPIWLGAPLINSSTEEVIGVIAIQDYKSKEAFNQNDLVTLEIIANNIGLFIDRVKNLEHLKLEKNKALEGEERYKSLFANNSSVMLLVDPNNGSIVDANKAACNFYGYSHKKITSININQINTLSKKEVAFEMNKAKTGKRNFFNFRHKLANGAIKHVEVHSGQIVLQGENFLYSIIHDVSKRKEAEEENTRLHKAIDQTPTPVALTDLEGYFTYVNPRYCELSEYSEDELIGKHTRILKSGNQSQKFYRNLWDTIKANKIWQGEIINKKKSGELYLEEVNIAPVFNEQGKATHYVKVSKDITEQKKMQDDLITAKEKAEESDKLKSAFLATMSHELRTPLNAIIGFSDLINENQTIEQASNFAKTIYKSGNHLLELIEDMFDLTLIESGKISKKEENFELAPFLSDIWKLILKEQETIGKQNLSLIYNLHPDIVNLNIHTDKTKLKQILINLLKNALKYTSNGSVEFACIPDKKDEIPVLKFYIKDTGMGIKKENQKVIFERFIQLDDTYTRKHDGLGIGLSVTKNLTELLNGSIELESEFGKGSTFTFNLPYQANELKKSTEISDPNQINWDNKTILIAEDEISNFELIKAILRHTEIKLLHAFDGKEAIKTSLKNDTIDLILMDIRMPIINGFEATKEIKKHRPNTPIIALTAHAMHGDKEKAMSFGCDNYIAKPINKKLFLAVLNTYLKK